MKKERKVRKWSIRLLMLMVIATAFAVFAPQKASQANSRRGVSVYIASFRRGVVNDLRDSELLVAQVNGYAGDPSELIYRWTNRMINTYLYVYNSHNMSGIDYTPGEKEINVRQSFSGQGFAYAAIYDPGDRNAFGGIFLEVFTPEGALLATASYSNFQGTDLTKDIGDNAFGLFEGDILDVRDLFGQMGIVHVTCTTSFIDSPSITKGGQYFSLIHDGGFHYSIKGDKEGVGAVSMSLRKTSCKFHYQEKSDVVSIPVYVFKKPTVSTTTTTLTLDGIDPDYTYRLDNKEGKKVGNKIIFEGLEPNESYSVEVEAFYLHNGAKKNIYTYVYGTTQPLYKATALVTIDMTTPADIQTILPDVDKLYLKPAAGGSFIAMDREAQGRYSALVEVGDYHIYSADNDAAIIDRDLELVIVNKNVDAYVDYHSVTYDPDNGEPTTTSYLYNGEPVIVASAPAQDKAGHYFKGWRLEGEDPPADHLPGTRAVGAITRAVKFKANWAQGKDINVKVTIHHYTDALADNPLYDPDDLNKLSVSLFQSVGTAGDFQLSNKPWIPGNIVPGDPNQTLPTSTVEGSFSGLDDSKEFDIAAQMEGYYVDEVKKLGQDEFEVILYYNPDAFDLPFQVRMDQNMEQGYWPQRVHVKLTYWGKDPGNPGAYIWQTIRQHTRAGVSLAIEDSGQNSGSYPVWKTDMENTTAGKPDPLTYYYRLEVDGYVMPNGQYVSADDAPYDWNIKDIDADGATPQFPADPEGNMGAYYDHANQTAVGTLTAEISLKGTYTVTLNTNTPGGTFTDEASDLKVLGGLIQMPNLDEIIPISPNGYSFEGWYTDQACTTAADPMGTPLAADTVLYAKWDETLKTVGGEIDIAHYLTTEDGQAVPADLKDRAKEVILLLRRRLTGEEHWITYKIETVDTFDPENNIQEKQAYRFDKLPARHLGVEYEYSVVAVCRNYASLYDNVPDGSYESEETGKNMAVFAADPANPKIFNAAVNVKLSLEPEPFSLEFAVDATEIGAGHQPGEVTAFIYYSEHGGGLWNIIKQMAGGRTLRLTDGIGSSAVDVWRYQTRSPILSSYRLHLDETTELPYDIYYGEEPHASFSPDKPDEPVRLLAKLIPKKYLVHFDLNDGDGTAYLDEMYKQPDGSWTTNHTWSFNTDIPEPSRPGYRFMGWTPYSRSGQELSGVYDEAGRVILGSAYQDIRMKANWVSLTSPEPSDPSSGSNGDSTDPSDPSLGSNGDSTDPSNPSSGSNGDSTDAQQTPQSTLASKLPQTGTNWMLILLLAVAGAGMLVGSLRRITTPRQNESRGERQKKKK